MKPSARWQKLSATLAGLGSMLLGFYWTRSSPALAASFPVFSGAVGYLVTAFVVGNVKEHQARAAAGAP